MEQISFEDFKKLEMRVGKIISAVPVENSEKLLKLEVDFGDEKRQVVSGIAKSYQISDLIDKNFVFVTNLEPRQIMGLESQAMILAVSVEEKAVCLTTISEVPPGSKIL